MSENKIGFSRLIQNLEGGALKPHSLPSSDSWKKKTSKERKQIWSRLSLK